MSILATFAVSTGGLSLHPSGGQTIEPSLAQLHRLAEIVKSDEFPLIPGSGCRHRDT